MSSILFCILKNNMLIQLASVLSVSVSNRTDAQKACYERLYSRSSVMAVISGIGVSVGVCQYILMICIKSLLQNSELNFS